MATNYVKFLRGTPEAFSGLKTKDKDTLYFISAVDAQYGKLYLGDMLVAASVTPDGTSVIDSLAELNDVRLDGLETGKVLGYDGAKWVPMDLPSAMAAQPMVGATKDTAGQAGLVPAPQVGDDTKFLRGDGSWQDVAGGDLSNYVTQDDLKDVSSNIEWKTLE